MLIPSLAVALAPLPIAIDLSPLAVAGLVVRVSEDFIESVPVPLTRPPSALVVCVVPSAKVNPPLVSFIAEDESGVEIVTVVPLSVMLEPVKW